jgi:hypothetical protein
VDIKCDFFVKVLIRNLKLTQPDILLFWKKISNSEFFFQFSKQSVAFSRGKYSTITQKRGIYCCIFKLKMKFTQTFYKIF